MSDNAAPAKRMARAREIAGLSLAQASHILGIDSRRLGELEAGQAAPEPHEAQAMAELYGAAESWLRGEPAVVPESVKRMLRDACVSDHDRDVIEEFVGMLGARTAKDQAKP